MAAKKFRHLSKKEKKKLLLKKNRMHETMFQLMRLRRAESARIRDMDEKRALRLKKATKKPKKKKFTDKVAKVRNRLTGRKRESRERWNRFAGTGSGGGRGL
jgi:hypothetical protein